MYSSSAENNTRKSGLACESCKRKKSKCDRLIPTCSFCQQSAKSCVYPTVRLKPGPKLGSTNRRRRNRRPSLAGVEGSDATVYHSGFSHDGGLHNQTCYSHGVLPGTPQPACLSPESSASNSSLKSTKSLDKAALNFAKAISLSSFFHPSHDASLTPPPDPKGQTSPGFLLVLAGVQEKLSKACEVLQMSLHQTQLLIDLYFEMVAGLKTMSLFHQPSFSDKIRGMEDHNHLIALFAAMFSLSSRFSTTENSTDGPVCITLSHQELHAISLQYINTALEAYSHSTPPLCLLQAMTLAGFYKLVNGVYGPAWRLVGSAVRVAYELRLHLIDYDGHDEAPTSNHELEAWSLQEERRRCWWALWEMDIFASTIQRVPTAIDWSMNETYLPVSDECWFTNKYQASCLLQGGPGERWRKLKNSGNENSVAWTIVLASLMHDAQILCHGNIQGIFSNLDPKNNIPKLVQYFSHGYRRKSSEECSEKLSNLVRAYQDITDNLPSTLSHRGEFLIFGFRGGEDILSSRRSSAGKYSIGMMRASASFMIYQNYVFADVIQGIIPLSLLRGATDSAGLPTATDEGSSTRISLQNFLEASNTVLRLLASCPEDHVKYVNPYYASTVWIAAALQIFKRISLLDSTPMLTASKYAGLRQIYLRFAQFWGTPLALLQNLDSLEARLEVRQKELEISESEEGESTDAHGQRHQVQRANAMCGESMRSPECRHHQPCHNRTHSNQMIIEQEANHPFLDASSDPICQTLPAGENAEWFTAIDPAINLASDDIAPAFPADWTSAPQNELFIDKFAWYTSDIMAGLVHGYTA